MPLDKFFMEGCISICRTVCRDQKTGTVKIWCLWRRQFDLYRPVSKTADTRSLCRCRHFRRILMCNGFCHAARAYKWLWLFLGCFHACLDSDFVVICRFSFNDMDGIHRTMRQTVAKSVAIVVFDEFCLAVYDLNGSLVAGCRTCATSITFFFFNMNNLSSHDLCSFTFPKMTRS